jgi:tetratricopeptide (TPR) repeat protein
MRIKAILTLTIFYGMFMMIPVSCSAKTNPTTLQKTGNEETDQIVLQQMVDEINQEGYGADSSEDEKWGDNPELAKEKYSLYIEYYKQENYKEAWTPLQELYGLAPQVNKGIYVHGINIIKVFIKEMKAASNFKENPRADVLIDSMMWIYDQRIANFGEKGYVLGWKGADLFVNRTKDYEIAYDILKESIDLEKYKSRVTVPYYFMYASASKLKTKKHDKEQFMKDYEMCVDIFNYNIENSDKKESWMDISDKTVQIIAPLLECEDLIGFYTTSYSDDCSKLESLKTAQSILMVKECTADPLFMKISKTVFGCEPSFNGAKAIGVAEYQSENYDEALKYFEEALKLADNDDEKFEIYMNMAAANNNKGALSAARSYALEAAKLKPEDGKPNVLIGDLYAKSAKTCGADAFEKATVYWIACDQYSVAINKGSEEASARHAKYKPYWPKREEAFFRNIEEGQSVSIGCWIGGTTTARFND